jgi:hypothetical protein
MPRRNIMALVFVLLGTLASITCSRSPVAPSNRSETIDPLGASGDDHTAGSASPLAQGLPGTYTLSFVDNNLQVVSTLPVGHELVLRADVASSAGPALRGSVQFQVCGTGGHSLQRLDPVPFSECDSGGSANWIPITTFSVAAGTCPGTGPGSACVNWGSVTHPRTIGFRFKYVSQGSGVQSGQSLPADFSWVP